MSIVLPHILYGIDVWCTPLHGKNDRGSSKGSVGFIRKLTSVQQAGALAITGGFRTSPTDSLDTHAALLPFEVRAEKVCHNAFTRMAALPCEHLLHKLIKRSAKRYIERHCSPLHTLAGIYGLNPFNIKKIPLVHIHTRKRGLKDIQTDIPLNKDNSKRIKKIKVYSDGLAHNGRVGTAAILKWEGKPDQTLKLHLGSTEQHTVYEAELIGMIMGLHLIKTEPRSKVKCSLSVDNQAALVAIKSEMNKLGQHLTADILQIAKQLIEQKGNSRFSLTFRWSVGHIGITGNKDVDKHAKAAADGESSDKKALPQKEARLQHLSNLTSPKH
jgi:ribonuclease HI